MKQLNKLSGFEFVALMAMLTSVVALSVDSMLPAFQTIGETYHVSGGQDLQWIVAALFLGFGVGQFLFGPLSDVVGRKPPIYLGLVIFMVGSFLAGYAPNFKVFLLGRFLQGFGGAAPRVVSIALIRDQYSGNAMAKITSLVMTVFILVPAIAPSLGQGILFFTDWRKIFVILFAFSALLFLWFFLRQPETLDVEKRKKFRFTEFGQSILETFKQPTTLSCMIVSGLVFGIFIGYLGAVQSIFADFFKVTTTFPLYFGACALSIGSASFFNSRLVMTLGMRKLLQTAMILMALMAILFLATRVFWSEGVPPLWLFMTYMICTFFSVGFLFGNLNALAMVPIGHIAGVGSALIGFIQSFVSVAIGVYLGSFFHQSLMALGLSFLFVALSGLVIMKIEESINNKQLAAKQAAL